MRIIMAAAVSALVAVSAPAQAAPVTYDITFTRDSGTETPTGFFTYNAGFGFTDFQVTHRGITFNLTASANAPILGGCASGATGFLIMAGNASCTFNQRWIYTQVPSPPDSTISQILFFASDSPPNPVLVDFEGGIFAVDRLTTALNPATDAGTFRISARDTGVPVPEPMTLALFGLGLAGLAAARRRDTRRAG